MGQRILLAGALAGLGWPFDAAACAACFGQSDSPLAEGMNMGILTLLFIVGGVLLSVAGFFVFLIRRAHLAATPATSAAPSTEPPPR